MKLWAIRHKPTGLFLPELHKPVRGGYTHTEPTSMSERPLRLFITERGAKNALWWWLGGPVSVRIRSFDTSDGFDTDEQWSTTKKPERKAEDMEVIQVELTWSTE